MAKLASLSANDVATTTGAIAAGSVRGRAPAIHLFKTRTPIS